MKLIVGLGNPGKKYEDTRHNIGFKIIKEYLKKKNINNLKEKFNSKFAIDRVNREKVFLMMPQTFMNLSGDAVIKIMDYYNISSEDITVIYDDLDLPLGKLRVKPKGGSGGHNGIKSIISHVGKEFNRIKIGIGRPKEGMKVSDYVLKNFNKSEEDRVEDMTETAVDIISDIISDRKITNIMNKYN